MKGKILFTRPYYDQATQYLHYISGQVLDNIKKVNEYSIIDLDDRKISRSSFEKAINKGCPSLVILNGHGTKDAVYGSPQEAILDECNVRLLAKKIVYAVACDSLEGLGEMSVKKGGAACYIGYGANFMIIVDPTRSATPSKDKNILPFIQVYATAILSLVAGLSVGESINATKSKIKSLIREYGVYGIRDQYGDAPLIRLALYWDLFYLNAYGDFGAVI